MPALWTGTRGVGWLGVGATWGCAEHLRSGGSRKPLTARMSLLVDCPPTPIPLQPMQIVSSVTAMASAYLWMPKRPHEMGILQVGSSLPFCCCCCKCVVEAAAQACRMEATCMRMCPHVVSQVGVAFPWYRLPCGCAPPCTQAWLAEFAWTEGDIPRKRAERASSLPPESFEHFCIDWWVGLVVTAGKV